MPIPYPPTYIGKNLPHNQLNLYTDVRWLQAEALPTPVERFKNDLSVRRTMYGAVPNGSDKTIVPGRNIFRIGGTNLSTVVYLLGIQYMETDPYMFLAGPNGLMMASNPVLFSPDGVQEFVASFGSGTNLNLHKGNGIDIFYAGTIELHVMQPTGNPALLPTQNPSPKVWSLPYP